MCGKMASEIWDVVVIGAGIIGNCSAYHAARLGKRTLKLEQFAFGHERGSSHGKSRITRYAHVQASWIPIVKDTYVQIEELEKKRGEKLWSNTGLVWMGSHSKINELSSTLRSAGCDHEILNNKEVGERFPLFAGYNSQWLAIFDPKGGAIKADKWMNAFHEEFLSLGGSFRPNCEVKSINKGDMVTLHTSQGEIKTKRLIVAAGNWINKLVPELNVKSTNKLLYKCYWKPLAKEDSELISVDKMPVFIVYDQFDGDRGHMAIGDADYPGAVKFMEHGGDEFASGEEPTQSDTICIDRPRTHLAKYLPKIDSSKPYKVDRCKYTLSPDHSYLVDYFGDNKNIMLCGMMSGTGFKVAPALGRIVAEMVIGKESPFDVSFFGASRFEKPFKC